MQGSASLNDVHRNHFFPRLFCTAVYTHGACLKLFSTSVNPRRSDTVAQTSLLHSLQPQFIYRWLVACVGRPSHSRCIFLCLSALCLMKRIWHTGLFMGQLSNTCKGFPRVWRWPAVFSHYFGDSKARCFSSIGFCHRLLRRGMMPWPYWGQWDFFYNLSPMVRFQIT